MVLLPMIRGLKIDAAGRHIRDERLPSVILRKALYQMIALSKGTVITFRAIERRWVT
jgi:hypothetical protein